MERGHFRYPSIRTPVDIVDPFAPSDAFLAECHCIFQNGDAICQLVVEDLAGPVYVFTWTQVGPG
jgi:hypothetical protein